MAKNRQVLIHIHSNVKDKAPKPEILELGEIAVNYADGSEKLYIRNASDQIVGFVNEKEFEESEKVTSAAIVKLNNEKINKADSVGQKTPGGSEIFNDYVNNRATSYASHAEGSITTASGKASHAEGYNTTASGHASHAEGDETTASGYASHAEGDETTASGYASHAEGSYTTASGNDSHAEGKFNVDISSAIHMVGIGTGNSSDPDEYRNAHTITTDGKHYIPGIGGYDGTQTNLSAVKDVASVINNKADFKSITYSDLKSKRDNKQLIPGTKYRITDYITTTVQEGTRNVAPENPKLKDLDLTKFPFKSNYRIVVDEPAPSPEQNYKDEDTFLGIGVEVSQYTMNKAFTLYKTDTSNPDWETDLEYNFLDIYDKFYYVGTEEVEGAIYDKWQKYSDEGGWPTSGEEYYLTPKIVKNNVPEQYDEGIIYDYIKEGEISGFVELPGTHKDIIVTALSKDKLSEEAKVVVEPQSPGSYYYSSKPEAWKIWYCLDNDKSRFDWADEVNGKGVIYRMIDEFGNDCPYDFKNILFGRYKINAEPQFVIHNSDYLGDEAADKIINATINHVKLEPHLAYAIIGDIVTGQDILVAYTPEEEVDIDAMYITIYDEGIGADIAWLPLDAQPTYVFTFNDANPLTTADTSLLAANGIHDNVMKDYLVNNVCQLNNNVFFGNECNCNSFGNDCYSNSFGNYCNYNSFGDDCDSNSFGNGCYSNSFGDDCYYNSFGNYCNDNSFGNGCNSNSFGDDCNSNSFGNYCNSNSFGDDCDSNSFGNGCYSNSFGNGCYSNSFGNDCDSNSFRISDDPGDTLQDYVLNCIIENGVSNVLIWHPTQGTSNNNSIKNLTLYQGLNNTDTNLPIQLRDELYNSDFQVKIAKKSNGKIVQYCEADLIADQN